MPALLTLQAESTTRAEAIADTPIFNALAATTPLFSAVAAHDATRRPAAHRAPASFSRSCVMPRSPMGGRHRRSYAEHTPSTGRHHLVTPAYA